MKIAPKSEKISLQSVHATSINTGTTMKEFSDQIIAYFNERSDNLNFPWSMQKLESRFIYGRRQVKDFKALLRFPG